MQGALAPDGQPDGPVLHEQDHEDHPAQQAVGVQQLQQAFLVHALGVDGDAPEDVGEGHGRAAAPGRRSPRSGRRPTPCARPRSPPWSGTRRTPAQDQREEQQEQRRVHAREQHGVRSREGREGHAARRDQPHFVAVPEGSGGVVDGPALGLVFGDEGQQRPDPQVEAVEHEVDGPQQAPQQEPYGFENHGRIPRWLRLIRLPRLRGAGPHAGPLRAYLKSRKISTAPSSRYMSVSATSDIATCEAAMGETPSEVRISP